MKLKQWLAAMVVVLLFVPALPAALTRAATLTVTNTNTSGPGSLSDAVTNAVAGDVITFGPLFDSGTHVIPVPSALVIDEDVTIKAVGQDVVLSGSAGDYIFDNESGGRLLLIGLDLESAGGGAISNKADAELEDTNVFEGPDNDSDAPSLHANRPATTTLTSLISNSGTMTLTRSSVSGAMSNDYANCGGGISNYGPLTLNYSRVFSNSAAACGFGGGLYSAGFGPNGSNVTVTLNYSAVYSNSAAYGGGISNNFSSTLVLNNSVIYSNTASQLGGGIDGYSPGRMNLSNSTISGNHAGSKGGGISFGTSANLNNVTISNNRAGDTSSFAAGGGIDASGSAGPITIRNSIIAGNQDDSTAVVKSPDCVGTVVSGGYNLLGANGGCTGMTNAVNGDQVGTNILPLDAKLGPLQNNGGPTLTRALLATSPAIDAGNPAGCKDQASVLLKSDQRGYPRPANTGSANNCDIGAFEFGAFLKFLFLPLIRR